MMQDNLRRLSTRFAGFMKKGSETDARAAKTKLKVSGGTRSDAGQAVRDTFLSLKQTCRKLKINFMDFLRDRLCGLYVIPKLGDIIRQRALAGSTSSSNRCGLRSIPEPC